MNKLGIGHYENCWLSDKCIFKYLLSEIVKNV